MSDPAPAAVALSAALFAAIISATQESLYRFVCGLVEDQQHVQALHLALHQECDGPDLHEDSAHHQRTSAPPATQRRNRACTPGSRTGPLLCGAMIYRVTVLSLTCPVRFGELRGASGVPLCTRLG
jgi:hypothetical protein